VVQPVEAMRQAIEEEVVRLATAISVREGK
jgi:hypothetical protein